MLVDIRNFIHMNETNQRSSEIIQMGGYGTVSPLQYPYKSPGLTRVLYSKLYCICRNL